MTYQEDLEIVIGRYHHERHRWLASDENPECEKWRRKIAEMASNIRNPKPKPGLKPRSADASFPPALTMAGNAMGAIGRAAGQLLSGGKLRVDDVEFERRMTICRACPEYDPVSVRCKKCSCFLNYKARLQSETGQCPLGKW
jgi:hypothetical protein